MTDPSPIPRRLQIYGERCSGTNWLAQLLRRNLPDLAQGDDFGWKHGWVYGDVEHADDCLFLVLHRDPFDWLRSLQQMPWHTGPELHGAPFSRFVRTPWRCVWGADMELAADDARLGTEMLHERDQATGQPFANAMRLRTAKMRAWQQLRQRVRHYECVRYEVVQRDPRAFVRGLASRYRLRQWPWFRDVTTFKGGRAAFRPKVYEPIAAVDLQWIGSELDHALEAAHGFDIAARIAELTPRKATASGAGEVGTV